MLWAEDGTGPDDSDPPYEGCSWKIVVLHRVAGDEGACSSQTCLAVHSDSSLLALGQVDKFVDNIHGGNGAIGEVEFVVFDVALDELGRIVGFVIEADDVSNSKFLEDRDVVFGCKGSVLNNEGDYSILIGLFIGR